MAARIARIELRRISAPLLTPYRISQHTYDAFNPLIAEIVDEDGRSGWGEAGITPGLTLETTAGGWAFLQEIAPRLAGLEADEAQAVLAEVDARQRACGVDPDDRVGDPAGQP